jgi:hypothetical protein
MERVGEKVESGKERAVGDAALLEFNMSDAAERYGVAANVIPHRIRREDTEKANA